MSVTAAMQPRLDQERTLPQRVASDAEAPATGDVGFIEGIAASFRTARDEQPTHINEERMMAYGELAGKLVERGQEHSKYWNYQNRGYGEAVMSGLVWADVEAERKKDPAAFADMPRTQAEFDAQWQAKMRIRQERDAGTVARTGWVPWLLGSLGAGLTDPVNVGAMLITGGGSTVLRAAGREAAINMGVEALELPLVNVERQRQGRPELTGQEALTSLALAGVIGGTFGAAVKGVPIAAKAGYEKFVPFDLRAARALDQAVPRYSRTPDVNAAINVALADAEIRAGSPFVESYAGVDAHFTRLHETMAKLENGVKVDVAPAATPAIANMPAQNLGGAVDAYMASARRQESGGNDGARSGKSSATGRYGFLDKTWVAYYRKTFPNTGLDDAAIIARKGQGDVQDRVMRTFTQENAGWLGRNGQEPTPGNLYVVHHMGTGGAGKVFNAAPDTPMASLFNAEVITANPHLAKMTAGEFRSWADRKMGGDGSVVAGTGAGMVDGPVVRSPDIEAARPIVDMPDIVPSAIADEMADVPVIRPDVMNDGLLTAMRNVIDDRSLSLNNMPALARDLGTDEDSLLPIMQRLVDEGRLTLTKSGVYRRKIAQGPEDALTFIARRGGLSYDGLDPGSRDRVGTKGHNLRNSGNLNYFVPQSGPLLRPTGRGLEEMGEALWDAGYFGPIETTPRPTEAELITWLDDVIRKKEKRYSFKDDAPEGPKPKASDFQAPKVDEAEVAERAARDRYWQRADAWNDAARAVGVSPMLKAEVAKLEALLAEGTDLLPPWREADLPPTEELAPYVLEMVNREIDDVIEAAYLEIEDPYYDFAQGNNGQIGGAAEGGDGPAIDAGTARAGEAGGGVGASPAQLDAIDAAGITPARFDETAHTAFDDPAGDGVAAVADSAWHDVRAAADPQALPPVPVGYVRMWHGGMAGTEARAAGDGGRWFSSDRRYAQDYGNEGGDKSLFYVDVQSDHPIFDPFNLDEYQNVSRGVTANVELPEALSINMRQVEGVGARIDPNIAARDAQRAQLGAEAPMRAKVEQDGTMGSPLFDAVDQPTFDLGDGRGARTLDDIEAEIDADFSAIDAIKGCML